MQPQILRQLGSNPIIAQVKQARAMLGAIGNPQAAMAQILQSNPQVGQMISQYGGINGAITALCQQKGIDPHELIEALK